MNNLHIITQHIHQHIHRPLIIFQHSHQITTLLLETTTIIKVQYLIITQYLKIVQFPSKAHLISNNKAILSPKKIRCNNQISIVTHTLNDYFVIDQFLYQSFYHNSDISPTKLIIYLCNCFNFIFVLKKLLYY